MKMGMRILEKLIFHPVVVTILRVGLGLVFIVASLDKIQHPESFATNIANYRLLPYQLINVSALSLPAHRLFDRLLL